MKSGRSIRDHRQVLFFREHWPFVIHRLRSAPNLARARKYGALEQAAVSPCLLPGHRHGHGLFRLDHVLGLFGGLGDRELDSFNFTVEAVIAGRIVW